MPTNFAIDGHLINQALNMGGHKTKKNTVNEALEGELRVVEGLKNLSMDFRDALERRKIRRAAFFDLAVLQEDYIEASWRFNAYMSKGFPDSHTDFLIGAVSLRHEVPIYTSDRDFLDEGRVLSIRLHP